jgi:hypothetical protein
LDDILSAYRQRLRFIKLDLEGGEYHAIRGGFSRIREDHPFIVFENGREEAAALYGYSRAEWFDLLASLGYSVFDLFGWPFRPNDWNAPNMPWEFVAVGIGSADEQFAAERLPVLVREVAASRRGRWRRSLRHYASVLRRGQRRLANLALTGRKNGKT